MRLAAPPRVTAIPERVCGDGVRRDLVRGRAVEEPDPRAAVGVDRVARRPARPRSRRAGCPPAGCPSPCCARSRAPGSGTPRSRRRGAVRPGCRRSGTGSPRRRRSRGRSRCRSPGCARPGIRASAARSRRPRCASPSGRRRECHALPLRTPTLNPRTVPLRTVTSRRPSPHCPLKMPAPRPIPSTTWPPRSIVIPSAATVSPLPRQLTQVVVEPHVAGDAVAALDVPRERVRPARAPAPPARLPERSTPCGHGQDVQVAIPPEGCEARGEVRARPS